MRTAIIGIGFVLAAVVAARAEPRVLDSFDDISRWSVVASDGVTLRLSRDEGPTGGCLRLDFDFAKGSGYCIARRAFTPPLEIPANYRFDFRIRGEAPANTLEFKMIAPPTPEGDNVWWVNTRAFEFPREWTERTVRARHVSFAWGPSGGKTPIGSMAQLELAISASSGGRGTVWIDELTFEPLAEARAYEGTPAVRASSEAEAGRAAASVAKDGALEFRSGEGDAAPWLELDFGQDREFGGLVIDWDAEDFGVDYEVKAVDAAGGARVLSRVGGSNGGRDYVFAPESDARRLRVAVGKTSRGRGVGVKRVEVMPLEFGSSPNELFRKMAADSPRGWYPRYFLGEQSSWTVVGLPGDDKEALINEEGLVEADKRFSLEPTVFLKSDPRNAGTAGKLLTWADVRLRQDLAEGSLPIPTVTWEHPALRLEITPFVYGTRADSGLFVRYRVMNTSESPQSGSLYVAARPFQVNPPWQFLNHPGGFTPVRRIEPSGNQTVIDGHTRIEPRAGGLASRGEGTGALERGDVPEYLARGELPPDLEAGSRDGFASCVTERGFTLAPGGVQDEWVRVLWNGVMPDVPIATLGERGAYCGLGEPTVFDGIERQPAEWRDRLERVRLRLPGEEGRRIADTVRTVLAHVLINADGPGIQPGSRSYERTWIRDGCLTSSALLALGHAEEVRAFLDWFAPFQYESGKIPCCVDRRGPDPVPEHDSHGQYVYAVLKYYLFTGDVEFLRRHWAHVQGAVRYMEALRAERMTEEFRSGEKRVFYGLLPESISHEGYSAKPMHSYWDDFFALKGLKDAATIAGILGEKAEAARYAALAADFRRTLRESIELAMAQHGIGYIPGCAELGDFDATSTTIGVWPCGELGDGGPLDAALAATFEKYWEFFRGRRDGTVEWEAYTPYETRVIGTFVRMGGEEGRERALEAARWFMGHQRPRGWNQWAEVVWKDAAAPKFIGDMPHTWVGSDFVNSVRAMLLYEREGAAGEQLVLMAGLPEAWVRSEEGIEVGGADGKGAWPTAYGEIGYTVSNAGGRTTVGIVAGEGGFRVPAGGVVVSPPGVERIAGVTVDGEGAEVEHGEIVVRRVPAEVVIRWRE